MEEEEVLQQEPLLSPSDFAKQIKEKYPQYKDINDDDLVDRIVKKYPQYKDRVDFSLKKKENSEPTTSEPTVQGQGSVSPQPTENTSSDTSKPIEDKSALDKGIEFANAMVGLRTAQAKDAVEHFKSGSASMLAGLAGIPNFLAKTAFTMFADDESKAFVNSLPQDQRESFLSTALSNPMQGNVMGTSADAQNYLTDISDEIASKTKQYNGNIVDDIGSGNVEQAAIRAANGFAESIPSLIMAAIPGGVFGIGASSAAQKQEELEREGEKLDSKSIMNSLVNGTAEGSFSQITHVLLKPLSGILKGNKALAEEFTKNFVKETFKSTGLEAFEEGATTLTQQLSDDFFKGKDISIGTAQFWKNVGDAAIIGGVSGGAISGATFGAARVMSADTKNKVKSINKQTEEINTDLEKDIPEGVKKDLNIAKKELETEKDKIVQSEYEKFKALSEEDRSKLGDIDGKIEKIKSEYEAIRDNPDISEENKKILLAKKSSEAEQLIKSRESLIDAKNKEETPKTKEQKVEGTTPKTEVKQGVEDTPSPTVKLNPENTSEKTPSTNPTPDAGVKSGTNTDIQQGKDNAVQPSVEPDTGNGEVEQKQLTEQQQKNNRVADLKNKFNALSDAKKKGNDGKALRQDIMNAASELGFVVGDNNGKISIKNENGEEVSNIGLKKNIADQSEQDIAHAVKEIDKGVLNWDGNPLSPRVDLGISRADVRKGEADIKAGNTNTVPAKRLIQALAEAKKNGSYDYIEGSGGMINRRNVPLTESLDADTEISVQDLKEINENQEQLSKDYDNWFGSLDENTQEDILSDYENKENNSGEVGNDAQGGKSQEDVLDQPKSQEGPKAEEPVKKADFEKKPNKKSLLNRVHSGGNVQAITDAIEKYGLDFETESQEVVKKSAKAFVDQVGTDKALSAIRQGLLHGAEKAFVYAEILDQLATKIESAKLKDASDLETEYANILSEIANEFDIESRESGRFISALNNIYNSSILKYNLTRQVEKYKAANDGVIDDDVLEKFTEASKKIEELEKQIKLTEEALRKAEAQSVITDIAEGLKNKSTARSNKVKAKALANKIRSVKIHKKGIFSSATPASLVFDSAVEIVAKSVEAGGTVADAIQQGINHIKKSDWYKKLSNKDKKEAEDTFKGSIEEGVAREDGISVNVNEKGEIYIPAKTLRSFVEQGITDIDEISQKILDEIKGEFPDITLRNIRDAISGYGKKINLSKDEIDVAIRKLKRIGKLISSEEDVAQGERPKRSGLQRDKITQEERRRKREINDAIRDLPIDESELADKWKNALDAVKSRFRNQIEDLEKQIQNKEKSKPTNNPIEYDQEAKDLRDKRDALKTALEEIVGKPELTEEQKIARVTNSLENNIEKLQKDIAEKNIEFRKNKNKITSKEIESLREQQQSLRDEINKMREDAGLIEKRRLDLRKQAVKNRIAELEKRIAEKDFTKTKRAVPKEDAELRTLLAEKQKYQEVFDRENYKLELKNRSKLRKVRDGLVLLWGVPRIMLATGEMSFVFIQGGIQTTRLAVRNPRALYRTFKKTFQAMASDAKAKEFERKLQAQEIYSLMKEHKLSLTKTDYKLEAKEETFQGDLISTIWDLAAHGIDNITKKKEYHTLGDKILNMISGRSLEGKQKFTLGKQFSNINPIKAIERGNTEYMNNVRVLRYLDGTRMLAKEGKNVIDHKEDYKKMATAINTLTGRADIGRLENVSDILNAVFFSFKNTVSTFNQLNPVWYLSLRSKDNKINKPSVAQKIAISDMMTFVSVTGSMMLLAQAAGGKDDDDEWKYKIGLDPRSTDFMKLKIGNIRFDPWHGMGQLLIFYSRLLTNQKINSRGRVEQYGTGYKSDTRQEITTRMVSNKFSPATSMAWKFAGSHDNKYGQSVDKYGNPYSFKDEVFNLQPIYWESVKEIYQEDPDLVTQFLNVLGVFGLNSMVFDSNQSKKKGSKQESSTKYNPIQNAN